MIDISKELAAAEAAQQMELLRECVPLTQLAEILPLRCGKKVNYSTLWRWVKQGCRGHKLQTIRIGQVHYVHPSWLMEFLQLCGQVKAGSDAAAHAISTARNVRHQGSQRQVHAFLKANRLV
jgi:hypothetical protein